MSADIAKLKEEVDALDGFRAKFEGQLHVIGTDRVFEIARSLIADLEETRVQWIHRGLRLAAAEKLIEAQRGALESMTGGSTIRAYGNVHITDSGERRHSVVLTNSTREKLAAARTLYGAYRKGKSDE